MYQKYGDRVAFIALSTYTGDDLESIAEYRNEHGISFPMGRDEDNELWEFYTDGTPVTVIVDRFRNVVFIQDGAFRSDEDVERLIEKFLGDGYTHTTVLESIPREDSTRAFPVSAARALYPERGDYQKVYVYAENRNQPFLCWIVPDDSVVLRLEVAADDDVPVMMYGETLTGATVYVTELLDPKTGIYSYQQVMPTDEDQKPVFQIGLYNADETEINEKDVLCYLMREEEDLEILADLLDGEGYEGITWEYAEADIAAENALNAYIIHVVDQDGTPVEEVTVNLCTDLACLPRESDETGTITFTGPKDVYHVQIVDAPDGYSWDESYEMYTTEAYGEWVLQVRKD